MRYSAWMGIILPALLGSTSAFDPYQPGPFNTQHKTYYPFLNANLTNMLDVWVADTDEPLSSPFIYFVGGLGGLIPGFPYDTIFRRVASYGITVVQAWKVGLNPIENYEGLWMDDVMNWVEDHLREHLDSDGIAGGLNLDHRNKFIMGHSAGGHVAVEYLKHHCGDVKGSINFSPVDGFDPFGLIPIDAITPGQYLNYDVPNLILMAGLDPVDGINTIGDIFPACAPEKLSNVRFYEAMPGNTWFINATDYGHADCLEDFFANIVQTIHFCACAAKGVDREVYRTFLAGEVVTFIKYILGHEDCDIARYLEDPALMPVAATVMHKKSVVSDTTSCDNAECIWQNDPFPHS